MTDAKESKSSASAGAGSLPRSPSSGAKMSGRPPPIATPPLSGRRATSQAPPTAAIVAVRAAVR